MSKKNLTGRTSEDLAKEFNEVCFRLGQEINNERRSQKNQDLLRERQEELEEAYSAAVMKEQEIAAQRKKAEDNTKAFEAKQESIEAKV